MSAATVASLVSPGVGRVQRPSSRAVSGFSSDHQGQPDFHGSAPGHYVGHAAVVARGEGVTYFFSADAGYTLDDMLADRTDGVTNDPAASLATIRKIKEFAAIEPTIVLPAHDPDGPRRLNEKVIVQ